MHWWHKGFGHGCVKQKKNHHPLFFMFLLLLISYFNQLFILSVTHTHTQTNILQDDFLGNLLCLLSSLLRTMEITESLSITNFVVVEKFNVLLA